MITDDISAESCSKDDNIEKDRRRICLLNDANYGIILCFLEKFRSILDLPNYSLQRLEDHLINYQEQIPPRLIDYHFILLKRLSLAKNTQRDKFDSIITKFASRFDLNDGDHVTTTGYLQADINVKIRILKNLLESQFDLNQTFKNTLIDKSAREIKSTSLGRDRFGVSYWLVMDTDCFVRLFREDVDIDRTWSNVAKNRDELEKFIQLLITDFVVRKKFSDWNIDYEPYSSLLPSNEFEECYLPTVENIKKEDEKEIKIEPIKNEDENPDVPTKKKRGRPRVSAKSISMEKNQTDAEIKEETEVTSNDDEQTKRKRGRPPKGSTKSVNTEKNQMNIEIKEEKEEIQSKSNDDEKLDPSTKRKPGRPRSSTKSLNKEQKQIDVKIEEEIEPTSNNDEKPDVQMKKRPGRPKLSTKVCVKNNMQIEIEIKDEPKDEEEEKEEIKLPSRRGRKRKIIMEESNNDDEEFKIEEIDKQYEDKFNDDANLSIRRSARPRKARSMEPKTSVASKTFSQIPTAKKKRSMNCKTKGSNDILLTTNNKSGRSRRRRKTISRRKIDDSLCLSTSSSDEHIDYLSEDEYDSDDYLPNSSQLDNDDNLFEFDEDNNTTGEELRTAKTAQASTIITACYICSKSDRPDVLLLCDDCDDAYHLECLRPALLSVPDGDWFCPLCEHKKLSNKLIEKLKELLINFNLIDIKRIEHDLKKFPERKIKIKEYSSDESITASESEYENLENNINGNESMLSVSQTNENSNLSSSHFDDINKNISQRGRHRRTRFDMNKMLNNHDESDNDSDTNNDDDEYIENTTQITNFDLQLPKKMTHLLNHRYRPLIKNDQRLKPKTIAPRLYRTSLDLNEKLDSPFIYVNGNGNSHQIKSIITNSNQTLKIVRRWNDVQRRSKFKTINMKIINDTTSDCADENSIFCPDETSPPRSNESNSNNEGNEEEDGTIIRSKITLTQPTNLLPMYKSSTRNIVKKNDMNFDRLTRDIQYAVSEANTLSTTPKAIDQDHIKRIQKTNFSPYLTKVSLRPLPVLLPKPAGIGYKIFKSKDPPTTISTTSDLSNIILTPSSSSSLLDTNDEQSSSAMNT